ncbi:hypothetical protein IAU60_006064 [Kwoniella sp. DSM 27419]
MDTASIFAFAPMSPPWTSPDDVLSSSVSWSNSLSTIAMTTTGSNNSSPTDFAFEPPATFSDPTSVGFTAPYKPDPIKTGSFSSTGSVLSPLTGGGAYNSSAFPFNGSFPYSNTAGSSFSSASGSATGTSFSSVDALPAISRDFARPSQTETRRPATAGGALQSRSPFAGYMPEETQRFQRISQQRPTSSDGQIRITESIEEEDMFTNPFGTPNKGPVENKQIQPPASVTDNNVDPHYVPNSRRASEPQFAPNSWQQASYGGDAAALGLPSAPAPQISYLQQQSQQIPNYARPANTYNGRPQTSDGIPSYPHMAGNVALPSAQSIARQIPGMNGYFQPAMVSREMPYRDDRAGAATGNFTSDRAYSIDSGLNRAGGSIRSSYMPGKPGDMSQSELTFVQLGGPAPKKRPRRRFDEIERLYACGFNGCEKSYGTLNHLNAHVAMQKHGEKRLPSEFKDMRKAWRKKKRDATAAVANGHQQYNGMTAWPQRTSIGSSGTDSEWDRRDSMMSTASDFSSSGHRSSQSYSAGYAPWSSMAGGMAAESRPSTSSSSISSVDGRSYFPQPAQQPYGMAPSGYMTNMSNNAARRLSAPQHMSMPAPSLEGFRPPEGDHPTPTAQNPFPLPQPRAGFPFATLTSPMSAQTGMVAGGDGSYSAGPFAFQR